MNILRFDSVGGASGDMILGALLDLGVEAGYLRQQLAPLCPEPFEIVAAPAADCGLRGTRVTVLAPAQGAAAHRNLRGVEDLIGRSPLPAAVREASARVFRRLAAAEAAVHGKPAEEVHFHEVGALDSIVDVAGACLALARLGVDAVTVGPLPLGSGVITCEHGVFPSPAPATAELLKGHPVIQTDEPYELVTPTGAALLMEWKQSLAGAAGGGLTIAGIGHGLGHQTLARRPNLLRAMLLRPAAETDAQTDECVVMECNLDDIAPELVGSLVQRLLAAGALEVFTTPVQMKKQRPGVLLTVLCHPERRDALADLVFTESTTFGLREHLTRRILIARRSLEVQTPYGAVRVKIGTWKGRDVTRSPEHDDCVRCADRHGIPVRVVYEAALRALPQTERFS